MRRIFILLLSLTVLFQGAVAAHMATASCSQDTQLPGSHVAVLASDDGCCGGATGGLPGDPKSVVDCGSTTGCHTASVIVFSELRGTIVCATGGEPASFDPMFQSLELRDVWRPPLSA